MMELVVKLPEGKSPFIGVFYEDKFDACQENEDIILEHKEKDWKVVLKIVNRKLELQLISEYACIIRTYPDLKYSEDSLQKWFKLCEHSKEFSFAQIYSEEGRHLVAKTFRQQKKFVLKLHSCFIWEK